MTGSPPAIAHWKFLLPVLLVTSVVFVGLFDDPEFIYDDVAHVVQNQSIRDLGNIPGLYVEGYWGHHFQGGLYRPFVHTTYALEYALFGLRPALYRLDNLLLHLINTALVFALVVVLTRSQRGAVIAALFFGLHPTHVEVVAGVVGRSELLATAATLGCVWLFCRYLDGGGRRHLAGSCVCVAVGLFSKETAIIAPVAMLLVIPLLWDRWQQCWSERRRELLAFAVVLAIIGAGWLGLRSVALDGALAPENSAALLADTPLVERVAIAGGLVQRYATWGVWPTGLSPDYALYPDQMVAPSALDYLPALAACIAAVIALVALRRGRPLAFGVLLFLLALLPVLNLVPIGVVQAVRFLYLPSVGLALVVGRILEGGALRWVAPATTLAAGALVLLTVGQVSVWRTNLQLWEYAVEVEPRSFVAHLQLARERFQRDQFQAARAAYREAQRLQPGDPRPLLGRARCALGLGDPETAMQHVQAAAPLAGGGSFDRDVFILQAQVLMARGDLVRATTSYRDALRDGLTGPPRAEPHHFLGVQAAQAGRFSEAREHLEAALALRPDLLDVRLNLSRVYRDLGQTARGRALVLEVLPTLPPESLAARQAAALARELGGAAAQR